MKLLIALCLLPITPLFAKEKLPRTVEKTINGRAYIAIIDNHTMVDKSAIYQFSTDVNLKRLLKDDRFIGEIRLHAVVWRKELPEVRWEVTYTLRRGALSKRMGARFADIETLAIKRGGMDNPIYVVHDKLDVYSHRRARWSLYLDPNMLIMQDAYETNAKSRITLRYDAGHARVEVRDQDRLKEAAALLEDCKRSLALFKELLEPRENVKVEAVLQPVPSLEHGRKTLQGLLGE